MKLYLASKSPRRRHLLESAGFSFEILHQDVPEDYPEGMPLRDVPVLLAQRKAESLRAKIQEKELLIAADTVVILHQQIIEKPKDVEDAKNILRTLSGQAHEVWSGVYLLSKEQILSFSEKTLVYFHLLSETEINHYLRISPPMDKAGAYGIQDWIGLIGAQKIEGCFYNVMGLPISRLYQEMKKNFPQFLPALMLP